MAELDRVAERSARGSLYLFLGQFVSEAVNAVGAVLVARLLTPSEYGVFGLAFVLPLLFSMFSNWGINEALIRSLARYQAQGRWGEIRRMVVTGFLFKGGVACLLSIVMFISADSLAALALARPELAGLVRLTSALVIIQSVFSTAYAVFYGLGRMGLAAAMRVIQALIRASTSLILILWGYGVSGAVMGHMLSFLTAAVISAVLIFKGMQHETSRDIDDETSLTGMLRFGFPLFIGSFLTTLNTRYQWLLLAWFTGDVAIGNLNIATKFISLVTLFTVPIHSTLYPAFSKFSYDEHVDELGSLFKASVRYATLIVIPVISMIILLSEQFVVLLFGPRYGQAPLFLSLALLQYLATGLGALSISGFLNSQGDTKTNLHITSVNVGLSVIACSILTWRLGVPGLLVGGFVASMAGTAYSLHKVHGKYRFGIGLGHSGRVALFSALSALAAYIASRLIPVPHTLVQMAAASVVFLVSCMFLAPLTGAITKTDIGNIRRILRRETAIFPLIAPLLDTEERIMDLRR
ncbi:MAG: flippase [Candidatus Bathyarchaeota archaeon]|nr:flippase [Candidatus Bathyarchaeota archaeon]